MPKDTWGQLRSRDRGRKSLATGQYERADTATVSPRRKKKTHKQGKLQTYTRKFKCRRCEELATVIRHVKGKDGRTQIGLYCRCGKWIKWIGVT